MVHWQPVSQFICLKIQNIVVGMFKALEFYLGTPSCPIVDVLLSIRVLENNMGNYSFILNV